MPTLLYLVWFLWIVNQQQSYLIKWALAVTLNLKTANQSSSMTLWPMMLHHHTKFCTEGSEDEEILSRWTFTGILNLSCDLDLDHNKVNQSFHKTLQFMIMCHQTNFSFKKMSTSEDVLESHSLIIWSFTVTLTFKTENRSFWKTLCITMPCLVVKGCGS